MLKDVFLVGWSAKFHDYIASALTKNSMRIVYWTHLFDETEDRPIEAEFRSKFPNTIFHSVFDAINLIPPLELKNECILPISKNVLERLYKCESTAMAMMDRLSDVSLSMEKRKRHYLDTVSFWYHVLSKFKPEALIYESSPHAYYDYILFELAKILGCKNIIIERVPIVDTLILYSDYREIPNFNGLNLSQGLEGLPLHFQNYYRKMTSFQKLEPDNFFDLRNRSFLLGAKNYGWKSDLRYIAKLLKKSLPPHSFKRHFGTPCSLDKRNQIWWLNFVRAKGVLKINKLRRFYKKNINLIDLNKEKYIFCGLHFQPERSSSPLGEEFQDQYYMIKTLSASIPEGWKIIVKEHPKQWSFRILNSRGRSLEFYKRLLQLPGVVFYPVGFDPQVLIKNSQAVATITGNIGPEAFFKGKPALIFGYPWYKFCEKMFLVKSVEDCRKALWAIQNTKFQVTENDHLKFLHQTNLLTCSGYLENQRKNNVLTNMPPEVCAESITKKIMTFLEQSNAPAS